MVFSDHYISHIKWKDTTHVAVVWTSRAQNESLTYICETTESGHVCSKVRQDNYSRFWGLFYLLIRSASYQSVLA